MLLIKKIELKILTHIQYYVKKRIIKKKNKKRLYNKIRMLSYA